MSSRRLLTVAIAVLAVASACSNALSVTPGDAVRPPELGDPTLEIAVLAADDLSPVAATVSVDGVEVTADGVRPIVTWRGGPMAIAVDADGFRPSSFTLDEFPSSGRVEFRLEPVVLSGRVTTDTGRPLPGATVVLGESRDTTDNEGGFALDRAIPGSIHLERPAWEPIEYEWDGSVDVLDMSMRPAPVHAIRASPEDILDTETWNGLLSLGDVTGVDAMAVELKSEDGTVNHATEDPTANAIGAVAPYFDAREVVAEGHEHGLYMIGRVGVFQDDFFASAEPDHAVVNEDGTLWRSRNGLAWLDPSDPASFEYSIALAEEACRLGFDEIQFDQVSYPVGGDLTSAVFDAAYNQEVRVASIASFLTRAYSVLHPMGCTVSTTVLGIVLESNADEGVGQRPATMSRIVDVLAPTLYTTNYGSGWKGFERPDDHPVEIVTSALDAGVRKLDGHAYLRPWLQTWTIDPAAQRAVQSAVDESGMGWQLWSNVAAYSADALPPRSTN